MQRLNVALAALLLIVVAPVSALAVSVGQKDTFDADAQGWVGTYVPDGGIEGAGDGHIRAGSVSAGLSLTSGPQWGGDYTAAGVRVIRMSVKNDGPDPVDLNLALFSANGQLRSAAQTIPPSGVWTTVAFSVQLADFALVVGDGALALQTVDGFSVGHNVPDMPAVSATLKIDNVEAVRGPVLNELRTDETGGDDNEYFELAGAPGASLDGLHLIVVGDGAGASGSIDNVSDLSGFSLDADGYFLAAKSTYGNNGAVAGRAPDAVLPLSFENSDNVTFVLVAGWSGTLSTDLDTDDDGVFDVTPWTEELDRIALVEEANPPLGTEFHYGPPTIGPVGGAAPPHVVRCPDRFGPFQSGTLTVGPAEDTAGTSNDPVCPMACGDGVLNVGEGCDDGNQTDGDGCPGDCSAVEPNFACETAGAPCDCVEGNYGLDCASSCPGLPGDICDGHGTCDDGTGGSGACACETGYGLDPGGSCPDIHECDENLDNCAPEAVCTNTDGSFECACPPGFGGDGTVCIGGVDLQVQVAVDTVTTPGPYYTSKTVRLNVTVENIGAIAANDVTIQFGNQAADRFTPLGPGCNEAAGTLTCAIGSLPAAGLIVFGIDYTVADLGPGDVLVAATAASAEPDLVAGDNTDSGAITLEAPEDCADGLDDNSAPGTDCDDPTCQGEPICNPCNDDYTFDQGPGGWTADGSWALSQGKWTSTTTNSDSRLQKDFVIGDVATSGPRPTVEVVYNVAADDADVLLICLNNPTCDAGNADWVGNKAAPVDLVVPNFTDENGFEHVFLDARAFAGGNLNVTLVHLSTSPAFGVVVDRVVVGSDTDADGIYEAADPSCDPCWDGDGDGFVHEESPGLPGSCPQAPQFDCNDFAANTNPNGTELCGEAGDEDCDGLVNGEDTEDCGVEDCANGVDDNGDGAIDCLDSTCTGDPFCNPCATSFTFESGPGGWTATDPPGAEDPDGNPANFVFVHGQSAAFDDDLGWSTVRNGNVSAANTTGQPYVKAWLNRTVDVPAGLPSPKLEIRYALQGDGGPGTDVFGVCFGGQVTACDAGAPPGLLEFSTSEVTTGPDLATVLIDIPGNAVGSTLDITIFYDTVDALNNDNPGLFIGDVRVRSDLDQDGIYEAPPGACDHCVDADNDGFAPSDVVDGASVEVPEDFRLCMGGSDVDCNDDDLATKPGIAENCLVAGDQNCNGLSDAQEVSCSACGSGTITAGETCDDGGTTPGDGCDENCQVEPGALILTELHVSIVDPGAFGERWIELYNRTDAPIDVARLALEIDSLSGSLAFDSQCALQAGKSSVVAPGAYFVVALGSIATADGLDADAACAAPFALDAAGDQFTIRAGATTLDTVDFRTFACETAQAAAGDQARSFELVDPELQTAGSNDGAGSWCLAAVGASYANSGNHVGSPGSAGTCAEAACDNVDDDCDGLTDELMPDGDTDGVCDDVDCDPNVKSCALDCDTDVDTDFIPDCRDGCLDADNDGFGVAGGAETNTCATIGGDPAPDCDDTLSIVNPAADETPGQNQCTNLLDDNCNGKPDCTESACGGTPECESEACAGARPVQCGELVTLEPLTDAFTCGAGADAVVAFAAPVSETVTVEVNNLGNIRYGAFVREGVCEDLSCDDTQAIGSSCTAGGSGAVSVDSGETYYIVLDKLDDCAGAGQGVVSVRVRCAEVCDGNGGDEDGDGAVDCADSDCVQAPLCSGGDFDDDGATNGDEITCGTDPLNPLAEPTADELADPDSDDTINCADENDDNDAFDDDEEDDECPLNPGAKNDPAVYPGAPKNCDKVGVDADCNGTFDTQEDACGAIEQQCGDGDDNDIDGKTDCFDEDCVTQIICSDLDKDADGVTNGVEVQCQTDPLSNTSTPGPNQAADLDDDGLANCIDTDDDGDGFDDVAELLCGSSPTSAASVPVNTDGDSQCDPADPDDDNDGFADSVEEDCDSDPLDAQSTPVDAEHDLDDDDVCDALDDDRDGDGWSNVIEEACGTDADVESDNPVSAGFDDDNDGLCDALDPDDDNDLWSDDKESLCGTSPKDPSSVPSDVDNDGVCDIFDADTDGDTWPDELEAQCGTNANDISDNPTANGTDPDGDKLCNAVDSDDDGDGWSDDKEAACGTDSLSADSKPVDTDLDQICNAEDADDDGDTWSDSAEGQCGSDPLDASSVPVDADNDGQCDALDPDADADKDGWTNLQELNCGTDEQDDSSVPADLDDDGVCDVVDVDKDGDGWDNPIELGCGTDDEDGNDIPLDTDQDGNCNALDTDDDEDGAPDVDEVTCGTDPLDATVKPSELDLQDPDDDQLVNCEDDDDDGDGISDEKEAVGKSNPLDPDTDKDGLQDGEEDLDKDGVLDPGETSPLKKDTDADGLEDAEEAAGCYLGSEADGSCQGTDGSVSDTDGDGIPDGDEDANHDGITGATETNPLVKDTDSDGAQDGEELLCASDPLDNTSVPVDKDKDGTCDGKQFDTDQDGIADAVEAVCGTDPDSAKSKPSVADLADADDDGVIDCVDADDDDDGVADTVEIACGTDPLDSSVEPDAAEIDDTDGDTIPDCADDDDDNDGLDDDEEVDTDPKDADTDDDGLSDGLEVEVYGTNPLEVDTDGDGIQDGTELGQGVPTPDTDLSVFVPDADPSTQTDPKDADTDNDGLTDGEEDPNFNGRRDPGEAFDPSNPLDGLTDSDGDTIPDLVEETVYGTDPKKVDTDGDALDDQLEIKVHGTDPLVADTDGGGVQDGFEVNAGTDPNDPEDDFDNAAVGGDNVFGCSQSTGGDPAAPAVVLLLLGALLALRSRRLRRHAALGLLAVGLLAPPEAVAQTFTGKVNTENFLPGGGRHRVWSVEESKVSPKWMPYAHLLFYGERESLRVQVGRYEEVLIKFRTMADLNIGVGLWNVLQLEVALPAVLQWEQGENVRTVGSATGAGIGDVMVRLRGTLLDNRTGGFGIGLSAGATFPTATGDTATFAGDPGVGILANAIFDFRTPRLVVALNAGVRIRTEAVQLLNETFEHDLTYGLGMDVNVWRGRIDLALELFGRTPLLDPFQSQKTTTLEVLGGPKWWLYDGLVLQTAVGAGLMRGYGAPDFRFTVGLAWAPKDDDTDGDGLPDDDDQCPMAPEDVDGYADDDGCPDDDNDGDGFEDSRDKCPDQREDMNGVDDDDGCPDADADGDGVPDGIDKCPTEREDADGFQDSDGCPELDNDGDGIQDGADKCPLQAEVRNGVDDEDGCPDTGGPGTVKTVVVERVESDSDCVFELPRIFFDKARHTLRPAGHRAVKLAAKKLAARQKSDKPKVIGIRLEGHASAEGTDEGNHALSEKRAEAVRAAFVQNGVDSSLLSIHGFGEAAPLVDRSGADAWAKNRRVGYTITLGGKCAK